MKDILLHTRWAALPWEEPRCDERAVLTSGHCCFFSRRCKLLQLWKSQGGCFIQAWVLSAGYPISQVCGSFSLLLEMRVHLKPDWSVRWSTGEGRCFNADSWTFLQAQRQLCLWEEHASCSAQGTRVTFPVRFLQPNHCGFSPFILVSFSDFSRTLLR